MAGQYRGLMTGPGRRNAGASDFVQKPFNPTGLMQRLKPLLAAA